MNNKEILNHIKNTLKEFELIHWKIEDRESYNNFLRYLIILSTANEVRENNTYWVWIADQINSINKKRKIIENLSNLKNNL